MKAAPRRAGALVERNPQSRFAGYRVIVAGADTVVADRRAEAHAAAHVDHQTCFDPAAQIFSKRLVIDGGHTRVLHEVPHAFQQEARLDHCPVGHPVAVGDFRPALDLPQRQRLPRHGYTERAQVCLLPLFDVANRDARPQLPRPRTPLADQSAADEPTIGIETIVWETIKAQLGGRLSPRRPGLEEQVVRQAHRGIGPSHPAAAAGVA